MDDIVHRILRFDRFALDLTRGCLRLGNRDLELRPKVFKVLHHLAENAGRLVSKEELQNIVWGDVIVSDDSLVQCVRQLRRTLGDDEHRLIKTVSRRGYLLDAHVLPHDLGSSASAQPTAASGGDGAVVRRIASPAMPSPPLALPDKPSIAVLPFENMSGDREQEYFADGMVEDITTALSRFKSLFVIARNSSFSYKGRSLDIRQVGRELGVRYVLEGSVRKAAGKVRITGQLVDCETRNHLWADRFDGSLEDVFELQDQVTIGVVAAVVPKVDQAEIQRAKRKPVESLDAYDNYLRGMAKVYEFTRHSHDEALRLFYRAIDLDADFVTPYAMAVRLYGARKVQGWIGDKDWEEAETSRLALRISAIGRDDAVALSWAGHALVWICRDDEVGPRLLDEALSINPNLAVAWQLRASISLFLGQPEAAIEQNARALRLSPLDPVSFLSETTIASAYLMLGKYDEAMGWAAKARMHNGKWAAALRISAAASALAGNTEEAQKMVAHIRRLIPAACISEFRAINPYRRLQDGELIIQGLRLAGMPE